MPKSESGVRASMPRAAGQVVRTQFNRWARNGRFLPSAEDPEAVHNYRVALRRLRTLLRAFRPWLPSIAPGVRRRLRRLMRGTNQPRNLEVLLAWVAAETGSLTTRQQAGAQWFASRLQVQHARSEEMMRHRISVRSAPLH